MIHVAVQREAIDMTAAAEGLAVADAGAVATFAGLVRADDGVDTLELEHYPRVTERALDDLAHMASTRWSLNGVVIVHRVGVMVPGETIVFVGTAAPHRSAALDACAFLIDRLKTDAPFWKRETVGGQGRWVEARVADDRAAERWREP